ncbi:MAG: type II secretion system F family protein [Caldanaerobacter sp.]
MRNILNTIILTIIIVALIAKVTEIRKDKFMELINKQLAKALIVGANAIRAGATINQSISYMAVRAEYPLQKELKKVDNAIKLGMSTEEALNLIKENIDTKEYKMVVAITSIITKSGGDIAKVYESISNIINERINFKSAVRSSTTYLRLTATLTTLIPLFTLLFMHYISPQYFTPVTAVYGNKVFAIYFIMVGIGWYTISSILRVEID